MSSNNPNIENPLELIQKTYNVPGTKTPTTVENSSHHRHSSLGKNLTRPASRKTSVHDIHETTRDDLNKILIDIAEYLSRLKALLETMESIDGIRDEYFKAKENLIDRINNFIQKLENYSEKRRGSINLKRNSTNLTSFYPQILICSIELFRNELLKSQYLFDSLKASSTITSSYFYNPIGKFIFNEQFPLNDQNMKIHHDINQIKKDISTLDEHVHLLNQRYYTQIFESHRLGEPQSTILGRTLSSLDRLNFNRFKRRPFLHRCSITSSIASVDNTNLANRILRQIQILCCICRPHYMIYSFN